MKRLALYGLCAAFLLAGCEPSNVELRNKGIGEFEVGHMPQAKELFERILDRNHSDRDSLYYMGRICQAEGQYERAMYYYQCALDIDPSHKDARHYLAQAQEQAGIAGQHLRFIP
jgi:tetratricopeptide (TPR) repeat protein